MILERRMRSRRKFVLCLGDSKTRLRSRDPNPILNDVTVNSAESKYIEKKSYRSRYAPERVSTQSEDHVDDAACEEGLQRAKDELTKFIPFSGASAA